MGRAVLAGGSSGALRASWPPGPLQELAHCEPAWESALQAGPPLAFGPPGPLQELAHCEPAWEAALQAVTASQLEALLTATEERVDRLAFLIRCAPPPPAPPLARDGRFVSHVIARLLQPVCRWLAAP